MRSDMASIGSGRRTAATRGVSRTAWVASWHATPTSQLRGAPSWRHGTRLGGIWTSASHDQGGSWSEPQRLSMQDAVASYPVVIHTGEDFLVFWTERGASGRLQWKSHRLGTHHETSSQG